MSDELVHKRARLLKIVETARPLDLTPLEQDGDAHSPPSDATPSSASRREPGTDATAADLEMAHLPMTDLGNAERFARRNRGKFIFVPAIGWLAWDGRRWARDGADELVDLAVHRTVRAIQDEASALRDAGTDKLMKERRGGEPVMLSDLLTAWGRSSESSGRLAAIPKLSAPYLARASSDLDADPWKITVLNGTIEIRRGSDEDPVRFRPHDPADLITKLAAVEYDPDATCPTYDRFLADVQPRPEMRRFLQQWGGYSLTGDVGQQKLCFFYGKGKNGKSTLVDAWGAVAGDYGECVPIETFLDQGRGRNAGAATPDLAILPGVRFLRTSEPEKGAKLAEALIKLVTGGEPIQARHLNRDYFKFRPAFKLTLSGNYRPSIDGTDEGIWRRLVLVPFEVKIAEADQSLPEKLISERPGILNRLLDGLRDFLDNGLVLPSEVSDATTRYREDSDPLGRFLKLAVIHEKSARTRSSDFHRVFTAWARASGEREWKHKGLSMAMKERGYRSTHSNGMWWRDLRLVLSDADFEIPSPFPPEEADG